SHYLNPTMDENRHVSPLAWIVNLHSIAAAHLERKHQLSEAKMREVIEYTRRDYASTLMKARSDPAATEMMLQQVIP
ncbi:peptidase S10, partial [Xylella fastidiosa subsp. multiplex]|nr:peptidase S10 [Xylella fastidiosa subsp. multiplex]